MHFVTFHPDHLLWIADMVDERATREGFDMVEVAKVASSRGPCLTLMDKEGIIACTGFVMFCKGYAEVWLRLSKSRAGAHAARELKREMWENVEKYHLHRLQATGPTYWEQLPRWWEWLGLKREGIMEKWGPFAIDHFLYAWVRQ